MSRSDVIRSERDDTFNTSLRVPAALTIAVYVISTLTSSSSQEELQGGSFAHRARDTQSLMLLRRPFSALHLNLHAMLSIATVLLMMCESSFSCLPCDSLTLFLDTKKSSCTACL
jgi:hypothetical protein